MRWSLNWLLQVQAQPCMPDIEVAFTCVSTLICAQSLDLAAEALRSCACQYCLLSDTWETLANCHTNYRKQPLHNAGQIAERALHNKCFHNNLYLLIRTPRNLIGWQLKGAPPR